MKKQIWGILLAAAALGVSGCGDIQLTDKQNSEAAEYMAGLILKYDKNYTDTLIYPSETEVPEVPEETIEPTSDNNGGQMPSQTDAASGQQEEGTVIGASEGSFTEVLGVSDIKVSFKDAYVTDEYKEDQNSSYVVYPSSGKRLAIVQLTIKNTSAKEKKIFLTERGVEYRLRLSDGTTSSSEITAISNDLNFLNTKMKAGKKETVVLIFSVPDSVKKVSGELMASVEQSTATLTLK